jgi:predicted small lipoprotein YifL
MHRTRSRVLSLGRVCAALVALAACGGNGATTLPSAAASTPVAAIASPSAAMTKPSAATAKPLPEHVIAEWSVRSPVGIYFGTDSVWVQGHGSGSVTRIDPASNKLVGVVPAASAEPPPVDQGFGSLWVTTTDNTLERVDPTTKQVIASIPLEDGNVDILNGFLVTRAAVWVIQSDKAESIKVDPATNRVVSKTPWTILIDEAKARKTVPAGKGTDFLWLHIAGDEGGGGIEKGLLRIDATSGAPLTFLPWSADHEGDGPITITDEAVWHSAGGHIYRINVATNQIDATYATDPGTVHPAVGFGSVWLANYEHSLVQRLDIAP